MACNASLLDELMGLHRNEAPGDGSSAKDDWKNDEVCKHFLCGFCPSELFVNTRADVGSCNKLHDDVFRTAYKNSGMEYETGYEERFLDYLQTIVRRLDRRLERCRQRLDTSALAKNTRLKPNADPEEVAKLNRDIEKLLVDVESAGTEGDVDLAKELMHKVERLKIEKERMLEKQPSIAGFETGDDFHEKMEVCQDCGCFLVINDTAQRIQSHLEGKQHMGFIRIRTSIEEIKVKLAAGKHKVGGPPSYELRRDSAKSRESEVDRDRSRDRSRDQDRSRDRNSRDEDRNRDRSRSRDGDRNRDRSSRDEDRNRDRSSRDEDRNRDRSRSRDRDRKRDHSSRGQDRNRDRSSRGQDRNRDRSSRGQDRNRDRSSSRDQDRNRDRGRDRSRDRDQKRGHDRSRSRDCDRNNRSSHRDKDKRTTRDSKKHDYRSDRGSDETHDQERSRRKAKGSGKES